MQRKEGIMRNMILFGIVLLMMSQCASGPVNGKPVPSISQAAVTRRGYEDRMERLYRTVNWLKGAPYAWGGSSPYWGMDCSGFTQFVMKEVGIGIPRTVKNQADVGQRVKARHVRPGDLVFFDASEQREGLDHVGIYLGNGYLAHSTSPVGVVIERLEEYPHDIEFGRRVMMSKVDLWQQSRTAQPKPRSRSAPERKPRPPKRGKGKIIKLELNGSMVEYTVKLKDGSHYEFRTVWENHNEYVEEYGNLLRKTVEWDEEYYRVKD
jgi:hypothetical protein